MRTSVKGKKSVIGEMWFWWNPRTKAIHLTTNDPDAPTFHVAIRDNPTKPSGHPYLFRELKKCLVKKGAPAPP
jgi:hypothetical protein